MIDYIVKGNTAFMLFAVKNMGISDKQKEYLVWSKLIDSFHFDEDAVVNLIYINHPLENYIGISVSVKEPDLLQEKIKRYSEGLAYLLVFYFSEADIRVLTQEECLAVVDNIAHIEKIPKDLYSKEKIFLDGSDDTLQILFARVIDPQIVLKKFYELYDPTKRQKPISIESKIGVKQKCDPRILKVLRSAYLCYSFNYFNDIKLRDNAAEQSQGTEVAREKTFIDGFLEYMSVPDLYIDKVIEAKSTNEIFDNPDIILVPPEIVAEFILGYRKL